MVAVTAGGEADTALKRRLILEDAADSRGNGTSQGTATGGGDPMDADLSVADMQPGTDFPPR